MTVWCAAMPLLHRSCEIIRGGMERYLTPMGPTKLHVNPIFEIGPLEPRYSGARSTEDRAAARCALPAMHYVHIMLYMYYPHALHAC